jgi:hypothetical protein
MPRMRYIGIKLIKGQLFWKVPMIEERECQHDCSLREAKPIKNVLSFGMVWIQSRRSNGWHTSCGHNACWSLHSILLKCVGGGQYLSRNPRNRTLIRLCMIYIAAVLDVGMKRLSTRSLLNVFSTLAWHGGNVLQANGLSMQRRSIYLREIQARAELKRFRFGRRLFAW